MRIFNKIIYLLGVGLSLTAFKISSQIFRACGDFSDRGFPFFTGGVCGSQQLPDFLNIPTLMNLIFWFSLIFVPIFLIIWTIGHHKLHHLLISGLIIGPLLILIFSPVARCREGITEKICFKIPLTYSADIPEQTILEFGHGLPFTYLYYQNWDGGEQLPKYRIVNKRTFWEFFAADYSILTLLSFLLLNLVKRKK